MTLFYLPTLLTLLRLLLVPVIMWLIVTDELLAAFVIFLTAGLTDALDGFLARRFGWETTLGAYLDALADKALLVSVYATLGFFGHLPTWLVILVINRDVLIIGAVLLTWLLGRKIDINPTRLSKLNTVIQITLAALILAKRGIPIDLATAETLLIWTCGLTTVLSAALYMAIWFRRMAVYDRQDRQRHVSDIAGNDFVKNGQDQT
ncbi:MAG TPA: CDP-alcohol phosphatidyltransferase family protein [Hyphomicrobiales bacterium]|nr:CDP-alcohol phosphatidyltransferase family protein [Hyphomicrobiales bacterium]